MSSLSMCVMGIAINISIGRFKISAIARLQYNTNVKLHVVVLVAFLSSGVRVAMVSFALFVLFSFLTFLSIRRLSAVSNSYVLLLLSILLPLFPGLY